MKYKVFLSPKANDFLNKLDTVNKKRVKKNLRDLSNNPTLGKPLAGRLAGFWSLMIGDFRAIYQIKHNELFVLVLKLGNRKNVYDFY